MSLSVDPIALLTAGTLDTTQLTWTCAHQRLLLVLLVQLSRPWAAFCVSMIYLLMTTSARRAFFLGWPTTGGVTRVGVTRGGNWRVSPFFPEKTEDLFLVIALCKVMTFFSCPLITTPTFRRHFSSVLSKFSHKIFFTLGVTPLDGVTRGNPLPLVTPLWIARFSITWEKWRLAKTYRQHLKTLLYATYWFIQCIRGLTLFPCHCHCHLWIINYDDDEEITTAHISVLAEKRQKMPRDVVPLLAFTAE